MINEEGLKGTEEKKPLSQKKLMWKGKKKKEFMPIYTSTINRHSMFDIILKIKHTSVWNYAHNLPLRSRQWICLLKYALKEGYGNKPSRREKPFDHIRLFSDPPDLQSECENLSTLSTHPYTCQLAILVYCCTRLCVSEFIGTLNLKL